MEILLHHIWKHRMLPLHKLHTDRGEEVEVVDPGLHNSNAGPDFFNAKLKVDGVMWVGNVEIHDRASDWFLHGHDRDAAYDNVILHVVGSVDMPVANSRGETVRQMQLNVPDYVAQNYSLLLGEDRLPPCRNIIGQLQILTVHSWMSALCTERLERKTADIMRRLRESNGAWEDAYFMTLARNFGFGANGDAFEKWAATLSLQSAAHHRDDLFQIETMFLGQAGLLDDNAIPERHRNAAAADPYLQRMRGEYRYLCHKFHLATMPPAEWNFMRLRPQNFPNIRISQLANLYYNRRAGLSQLTGCKTVEDMEALFATRVSPYWETHYTFGAEGRRSAKQLSTQSVRVLILNTAVPVLFAYGRHKSDETLQDRAFALLDELKAEDNSITRMWRECGLDIGTAADSQAIIQLKKEYCDRRECLRCRFGYEFIKRNGWFVKEEDGLHR